MRFDNPREGAPWSDSTGTALVDPAGYARAFGPLAYVYNAAALRKWSRRYGDALTRNVNVALYGDSLAYGSGPSGGANADDTAAVYGLEGRLRTLLNAPLGTKGGGFMSAQDLRVTKVGGGSLVAYGPLYNSSHNNSRTMNAGGVELTFALPACTAFDVYTWEDYTATYGRTTCQFSYDVDAAGAVTLSGSQTTGSASLHRVITGASGLGDATHSVVLAHVAGNNAISGLFWKYATGVSVTKFAVGGFTSFDMLGQGLSGGIAGAGALRVQAASYVKPPIDVAIILVGHNDCSQQVAQGTTPAAYKTYLQQIITLLGTNTTAPPILLLSDPDPNIAAPSTYDYPDYWPMLKQLATENANVAAVVWSEVMGDYTAGNAESMYADTVHQTSAGYARMARFLTEVLRQGAL